MTRLKSTYSYLYIGKAIRTVTTKSLSRDFYSLEHSLSSPSFGIAERVVLLSRYRKTTTQKCKIRYIGTQVPALHKQKSTTDASSFQITREPATVEQRQVFSKTKKSSKNLMRPPTARSKTTMEPLLRIPDKHASNGSNHNNEQSSKMVDIEEPHSNDVLCGRGVTTNKWIGNEQFRSLVGLNKVCRRCACMCAKCTGTGYCGNFRYIPITITFSRVV